MMLKITGPDELVASATASFQVRWDLSEAPDTIEAHLIWRTEGKGDTDSERLSCGQLDALRPQGCETLTVFVPEGPFTYHGKLLSILWTLELTAGDFTATKAVRIGPR